MKPNEWAERSVLENTLVHRERAFLVALLLLCVAAARRGDDRLVECAEPEVAEREQRVRVAVHVAGRRIVRVGARERDDLLELLLARAPLALREVQVADQRPGVRIVLNIDKCAFLNAKKLNTYSYTRTLAYSYE